MSHAWHVLTLKNVTAVSFKKQYPPSFNQLSDFYKILFQLTVLQKLSITFTGTYSTIIISLLSTEFAEVVAKTCNGTIKENISQWKNISSYFRYFYLQLSYTTLWW